MLESGSQFLYGGAAGVNSFIPVCPVVTSKRIINVYHGGCKVGGDGRKRQIL
jgi:hypothetical protein